MLDFIIMTLSFTIAIGLVSLIGLLLVLNEKFMKWYMKKVQKITNMIFQAVYDEEETV